MSRWGVVFGLAAVVILQSRAAHADEMRLAQSWPAPGSLAPDMPPVAGPRVMLRVDNLNGRLQQHTQLRWRDICIAPCGATVDPTALYRIGGGTSMASEPFQLPRSSGDVYIDAQVGSKVKHWVGLGMMIGGLVAAGYGLIWWKFFDSFDTNNTNPDSQGVRDFGRTVGIVFLSVGGILEAVGLPMFFSGTSVEVR